MRLAKRGKQESLFNNCRLFLSVMFSGQLVTHGAGAAVGAGPVVRLDGAIGGEDVVRASDRGFPLPRRGLPRRLLRRLLCLWPPESSAAERLRPPLTHAY